MHYSGGLDSVAASGQRIIEYGKELTSGLTTEQLIKIGLLVVLGLAVLKIIHSLIKAGKFLVCMLILVFTVGLEAAVVYDVTQVTEKAMCFLEPVSTEEVEIDLESETWVKDLENVFVDADGGLIEKIKNTRLTLLLSEVIEREVENDENLSLRFEHFNIEVYSGTVCVVPKS